MLRSLRFMVPELRARGIGEMLDLAVTLSRARFGRLIALSACIVVPVNVLTTLVLLSAQPDRGSAFDLGISGTAQPNYDIGNAMLQLAATLVVAFIGLVASAFVAGICARPVADAYVGSSSTWKRGSIGGRGFVAVFAPALLFALAQVGGTLACGVGAYATAALFAVALPVVVLERAAPGRAMGRSLQLTKQHFFRVLGIVVSAQLLQSVLDVGITTLIGVWMFNNTSSDGAVLAQGLATGAAALITEPFFATVLVVIYFDVRIREEGFDIQLLMQRNDERHAAARVPLDAAPLPQ
jgi:hypothetical protein